MDQQGDNLLRELDEAGLADNTILFYDSDHDGILPRSKRFLYDTGVHVPMIVRFPPKYRHLAPAGPGSRTDRPVSFVDLAPIVLSLAGVPAPDYMQGHAFLGPQATEPPRYPFMFRGRMDERYDMIARRARPTLGAIRRTAAGAEGCVKRATDRAVEVPGP